MTTVTSLGYVVYEVSDLADWKRFAVDLLGMQVGQEADDLITLRTDEKAHRWILVKGSADDLIVSGYEVESADGLAELVERVRATGTEITEADAELKRARRVRDLYITSDPVGNRIELCHGLEDGDTPWASGQLLGRFVTGGGGAGHQVLMERDVDRGKILDFYLGTLGFKVSDYIVQEMAPGIVADVVFLHCNPRHHTVAFANMPEPKRTHHFMVEVTDVRDVGLAYYRCLEARQPIELTLGMHPNDRMFGFYVKTPSGFNVEFGWGGVLIDDSDWQVQTLDRLSTWGHHPVAAELQLLQAQV